MTRPRDLLSATAHRPWPVPDRPWIMRQSWHDLAFLHWPVAPDLLRPLLPAGLALDTYAAPGERAQAWVGVVPFRMSGIRLRGLPAVPGTRAFPELNVRTYVRMPGNDSRAGVWFFSLDAANGLAVRVARAWFHLPYMKAHMRCAPSGADGQAVAYESMRTHRGEPPATFRATYGPDGSVERASSGTLLQWLTERYSLYAADKRGGLLRGEIHHAPWPLQPCAYDLGEDSMAAAAGIDLSGPPALAHFARRLDVLAWAPERLS